MNITISVSEKCEGTSEPYWLIIDPRQMMKLDVDEVASMITGPFFSREEANSVLQSRRHHYSRHARVYCHSGYDTIEYKNAIKVAGGM